MYPHDPAARAYQQWLQQQQPTPQYTQPTAAFPFAFPAAGAQQQLAPAAPLAPSQYMPPPPAPLAPQYIPPPPAFHPSPFLSLAPRRPRQLRQQQQQREPEGNEFVSLSIILFSLLIGAAFGAVGEHHRLSSALEDRLSSSVKAGVFP